MNIIYGLRDPRTDEYRYIGKSTSGLQRAKSHLIYSHNEGVNLWVYELRELGLIPKIDILEECDLEYLQQKESFWVNTFKEAGCFLLNEIEYKSFIFDQAVKEIEEVRKKLKTDLEIEYLKYQQAIKNLKEETIGQFIKRRRKELNIMQEDFAEIAGISKKTFRNIEKEVGNPSIKSIISCLNVLNCELCIKEKDKQK